MPLTLVVKQPDSRFTTRNLPNNSFEIIQRILPYCDKITVLTARCEICGKENATRCVRYNNDVLDCDPSSSLILIESEKVIYKSVCKECYRNLTSSPAIK